VTAAGWLVLALSQLPAPVDPGALAGRVCVDEDQDGRCSASEPGVSGVRVLLETGHWAVTDAKGRYHFAAIEGRRFDPLEGETHPRLVYGRHRIKLDPLTLDEGAKVVPKGATVEVPVGGLATQDFAVTVAEREVATVRKAAKARPRGELLPKGFRVQLAGEVSAGERVWVQGREAEVDKAGVFHAWVEVGDGRNRVPIRVEAAGNRSRFYLQTVEIVRRDGSVLVVPRPPEAVGLIGIPASATGGVIVAIEAPVGTRLVVEGVAVELPESRRLSVPLPPGKRSSLKLQWTTPGGELVEDEVRLEAASGISVSGLIDLEGSVRLDGSPAFGLAGRGAAALRGRLLGFDFSGELDLRDEDFRRLNGAQPASAFVPRDLRVFERAIPAIEQPPQWADDSVVITENPAGARLRAEVSREGVGRLGFGSYRAVQGADAEVGRMHRSLTAAYLEAQTPQELIVRGGVRGFYAPNAADVVLGQSLRQRHDRFEPTGGSLFYLSAMAAEGSERVRIEYLDGITGLPIGERHLRRGVDYSIDNRQGRILLSRPLWAFDGDTGASAASPTASRQAVLWVDYETVVAAAPDGRALGGEVTLGAGPVRINAGAVSQAGSLLYRGNASAKLGPVWLGVEVGRSVGLGTGVTLQLSDDGGLSFAPVPDVTGLPQEGLAITARARGKMFFGKGSFDAAWRMRSAGFVDAQHLDLVPFRQWGLRFEQPIASFVIGGHFDDRVGADPRFMFSTTSIHTRVIGGFAGYEGQRWGVRLEARDVELDTTGRTSVGVSGRFAVTDWLTLRAGYRQRLLSRNGGIDDTFASAGFDLKPTQAITLGVRGGWGPGLGPQVWGHTAIQRGDEVFYGGHALDLDAPALGEHRVVTGARKEVEPGTSVYVEDAAAHDATSLRMSRAVGLTQALPLGLSVSARYERGVRTPFEEISLRERDAGGLSLSWVGARARAWVRGEVRSERSGGAPELLQGLAWGGGEAQLTDDLRATLSALFSHSTSGGGLRARLFEGAAALAWRFTIGMAVLRYTFRRELKPGDFDELFRHRVSLLPSVRLFSRVTLHGGAHLQYDNGGLMVMATLRPTVRVVGGLELGVEGAITSTAIQGSLTALRAEVGYRFGDAFLLAVGGTIIGFNGLDAMPADGNANRIYVRAEAAY